MKRRTVLLGALGLALVGLLAGILGTLFFSEVGAPDQQFVRRVELSGPSAPPGSTAAGAARAADTGRAVAAGTPSAGEKLGDRFERVAGQVRSSVVYIQVRSEQQALSREGLRDFGGDGGGPPRLFERRQSVGSGVIISPDGYIVTNNHVVKDAERIEVNLADRRRYEAEVVGTDPSTDLAVIRAKGAANLPALPMGNSDQVEVGERVLAVGNPFRLTSTVTAGIVSALGRQVGIIDSRFGIENFIQTDAAINPGNSGGALVNMQGELVGVATAIASEGGSYEGYGFAVPSNLVERVTKDLVEQGEVERALLGVSIGNVSPARARRLGLEDVAGAYISDVKGGSAADQAGIREGDVVQAVGERDVAAPNDLQSAVARQRPGDTVQVQVWRDGAARTLAVRLMGRDAPVYQNWVGRNEDREDPPRPAPDSSRDGNSPEGGGEGADPQVFNLEGWGLGLRALTAAERDAFSRERGVFVAFVAGDGMAGQAGVPRGTVVTAVDGTPVGSVEAAIEALQRATATGEPALLRVKRRDGTIAFYEVAPPR
jgi:Do/DeqQ family serine protease